MSALLLLLPLLAGHSEADRPEVIVVVGADGTPEFGRQFAVWAARWQAAAERGNAGFQAIGSTSDASQGEAAENDRDKLQRQINARIPASAEPLWLVLIGHGTFDGKTARLNLRGPDVSAQELAEWLKPLQRPVAIVNCTSASAPFLQALSGTNRIVITATKSGHEHNFARFGDYMSAAIGDAAADLDKDDQTSLLEAFLRAAAGVKEFYGRDGRLVTEHALLDDNGDRLGTPGDWFRGVRTEKVAKDGASADGLRAHQWHLVRSTQERELSPAARKRRDELEAALATLRARKSSLAEDAYLGELELVLVELARLYHPAAAPAAAPAPAASSR